MCKHCSDVKTMSINYYERIIEKDMTKKLQLIRPTNDENCFYLSYCPFCGRKLSN